MSQTSRNVTRWRRRDRWLATASGLAYVGLGALFRSTPRKPERVVFSAINHDTSTRPVLVVPQQLGTPWVLPALAGAAFAANRPHLAVAAAAALPVEKALEVGVKKALPRRRPAQVDPDAQLHDDAPTEGPSYPSGHAAIAFTAVLLLVPALPDRVVPAGVLAAGTATWVRVRQGAHFPVDVAGGLLLGAVVAFSLRAVVGYPDQPHR